MNRYPHLKPCQVCGRPSVGQDPIHDPLLVNVPGAEQDNASDYCWRAANGKTANPERTVAECDRIALSKATAQLNEIAKYLAWSREWWDGDIADEVITVARLYERNEKEAIASLAKVMDPGDHECHHARAYAELHARHEAYYTGIGVQLEGVRARRPNREPARSDSKEVAALVRAFYEIPRVVQDEVRAAIVNVRDHEQAVRYAKTLHSVIKERLSRIMDRDA